MSLNVGLTGGIASGKSSVSHWLSSKGYPIIDADVISRQVVEPGQDALNEIIDAFGQAYVQENGALDRKKLGAHIFSDDKARETLNHIVHPAVQNEMKRQQNEWMKMSPNAIISDIPLLFENGRAHEFDTTLLVYVSPDIQLERLMERDQLTEEAAKLRIQSQMTLQEKKKLAHYAVDNSRTFEETIEQLIQWINAMKI
ncbi:dephospho-CoA kinase [Aureibacillus halotolerans]|uniref:Dephospho-CoA kinase n=1 Tax=Aureibacillus halotolerans TaxID=1508390 RepID=A0A4R6TZS8_9BACI|nr:dephospho-CoA kinase [Aureibacillus halotolerans]TDQ39151.1 dephospho-CoA kinase [Aureibacillus halotolerans]